jgi:hypothetical protein
MRHSHLSFIALTLLSASAVLSSDQPARAAGDRIFAAESNSGSRLIYEITGAERVEFAAVNHGGYVGPLALRGDGRVFVTTDANNISLYDITDGGDLTQADPLASNLFTTPGDTLSLAFDDAGNAYIGSDDNQVGPIAVLAPDGSVDYLPGPFSNVRSLLVLNGVLYIAEGGPGRVLLYDLSSGETTELATGFATGGTNISGALTVDQRGRVLTLWAGAHVRNWGLIDITDGGDFADEDPAVRAPFRIDVNQMAVDSNNNLYVAGNESGAVWICLFDGKQFGPMQVFVDGMGDNESVMVLGGK